MPSFLSRALQLIWRARFFVPAIALAYLAAPFNHPAVLVPLLLAQPLFLAGAVCALGYHLESDFALLSLRRGSVALVLIVVYTAWVALLAGAPLIALVRAGTPELALLLSAGFLAAAASLWRLWPVFALVMLWDDAYPAPGEGSWMLTAISRGAQFARHLSVERDPYFGRGLPLTLLLMVTVSAALSIAGLCGLLPSELKLSALALFALVLCPLTYTALAWRTERLLLADAAEHDGATADGGDDARAADAALPAEPGELRVELLAAAAANQVDRALALLRRGADANAQPLREERDQRSLAIIAATAPDLRLLREAIARGADVNRAVGDLTPLLAATRDSYQGRPDAVLTLLANGADPRASDAQGNTPLHHAVLACEPSVAAILLDADAPLEAHNKDGLTPLGAACAAGNVATAKLLLERAAQPNPPHAVAALTAAAGAPREAPDLVRLLVRHRAQVSAHDKLGRTALHAAALHGHAETLDALLAAGAALNARDALGVTALMEAARGGHNRVLQRLVFRKPEPDHCDHGGRSALVIACQSRQANEETVRLLLAMHVDAELVTNEGKRAIDYAVAAGRWPVVALLDPSYPLPSSLRGADAHDHAAAGLDRVDLLGQALRHGRPELAEELLALEPALNEDELARAFLAAAGEAGARALERLFRAGLRPEHPGPDGQPLLAQLAHRRPLPLAAIELLVEAGASPSGAASVAVIEGLADERLALVPEEAEMFALDLIARGAETFRADARGRTPAHLAGARGQRLLLEALLARGADPNAADARGRTPLAELAALPESTSLPLARALLAAGADPERRAGDGQTALGAALAAGRGELARWFTAQVWRYPGRRLFAADLPAAAAVGDTGAVVRLIELGLPIDARDAQGCTGLLRACGAGHESLVATLLERGADAGIVATTGASCLSAAVSAGHVDIVELLLANGVAVDATLPGGATALMVAAALGAIAPAQRLLAHGASVAARDEQGQTALHAAAQFAFGSAEPDPARRLFELLLDAGAELDAASASAQTPLLLLLGARAAAGRPSPQRGLVELVELLLARGADLDAQDQRGVGVLHACAMHGLAEPCRVLLRAGAQPGLRDALGRTAAEVALMLGYADLAAEIKRAAGKERVARAW